MNRRGRPVRDARATADADRGGETDMGDGKAEPTGREIRFDDDDIIVSKTDLQGRITYANDVFLRIAGYRLAEVIGQPHSLIRHPDMPRAVFKALWDTIAAGREIFAYVMNLAKNGDHYWVFAHVTPSFDARGRITEYHSNRRTARPSAVAEISRLYAQLRALERATSDRASGLEASSAALAAELKRRGQNYDEFVWSVENASTDALAPAGGVR
jgi:PAS domain S-box-containing protein